MKPVVLYSSKSGNTRKIADAIAAELRCQTVRIDGHNAPLVEDLDNFDLIFVGTGIYAGNPNADIERYLKTADLGRTKLFAIFIIWGGAGRTCRLVTEKLKSILEIRSQKVINDTFSCYGGWRYALLRKGHPNIKDMEDARKWARKIINTIY